MLAEIGFVSQWDFVIIPVPPEAQGPLEWRGRGGCKNQRPGMMAQQLRVACARSDQPDFIMSPPSLVEGL